MIILKAKANERLLPYLKHAVVGQSRSQVKKLLEAGCIKVNGHIRTRFDFPLEIGDRIQIDVQKRFEDKEKAPKLKIVYESGVVIVIEKPAGLLSVATDREKKKTAERMLNEMLQARLGDSKKCAFPVHRLDRDVSGLLLFVTNEAAKQKLIEQWGNVEKHYYAVVEGRPNRAEGLIKTQLKEDEGGKMTSGKASYESKYAVTRFRRVQSGSKYSLMEVELLTGRKNQIRVHLAEMGHPIAGDEKFGALTNPLGRIALHAYRLSFPNPETGQRKTIQIDLPYSLKQLL